MPWAYSENICEKWLRWKSGMNWYSITGRKIGTTRTTTSGTESTKTWTPMTTLTTGPQSKSTTAWRFTTCTSTNSSTERAHVVLFLAHFITLTLAQVWVLHLSHPSPCHTREWLSLWLDLLHSLLPAFLLSVFLFPFYHLSDEQQPKLNKKFMENLHNSANNGGEDTYDFFYLHTGYEPKGHDFDELQNSSVHVSFKIPVGDQDVDDLTLGKMLTEAYRGQVDYFV